MNKFTAMSLLISKEVMNKSNKDTWYFSVNGQAFGMVSKADGLYYAHYKNRSTTLRSFGNFMQAVKELLPSLSEIMENFNIDSKPVLFSTNEFLVRSGTSGLFYIKQQQKHTYKTINLNHNNLINNLDLIYPSMNDTIKEDLITLFTKSLDNLYN